MHNVYRKILGEWSPYLALNFLATNKKGKQSRRTGHTTVRLNKSTCVTEAIYY